MIFQKAMFSSMKCESVNVPKKAKNTILDVFHRISAYVLKNERIKFEKWANF